MKKLIHDEKKIKPVPIQGDCTVTSLVDNAFLAYNGARTREACHLFCKKYSSDRVLTGISLTGALTPAGIGITCLIPLMRNGLVDWIVTTGANLYHDLHFSLDKALYRGSPHYDDIELKEKGIIRIYDIVFEYDVLLSTDQFIRTVLSADEFRKEMGTAELHYRLGRYAAERENQLGIRNASILSTAFELDIPVYTPSPADSSIGMNIAALDLAESEFKMNPFQDVNETAAFVYSAKKKGGQSGVLIVGGGSPKNFILQTEPHIQEILGLTEAGHDYFIQITDARPDTGGLSGATPSEAVSWGKIDPGALPDTVVVYCDSTITLPILTAYALSQGVKKTPKRLYNQRDALVAELKQAIS